MRHDDDTDVAAAAPRQGDDVGREYVGRYVLLESLGSGGMGAVYAAWDRKLARRVALKILHPGSGEERLLREAQAMAQLAHPNVVKVYDVGRDADDVFIAMELVEGTSLRGWLDSDPRGWRPIVGVFLAAARGLAAAHQAGIVHRDFKPDNVLVGNDGIVRVVDFGLARAVEDVITNEPRAHTPAVNVSGSDPLTRPGTIVGTPRYMAPEQRAGKPLDARADQFSFCVSLWEALFGEHPGTREVRGPGARGGVPRRIRRVLGRGLSVDADGRWRSMDALAAALDTRTSRAGLLVLGATAVAAAIGFIVAGPGADACTSEVTRAGTAWGEVERAGLRAAFGGHDAAPAADRVIGALDRYGDDLAEMARDACTARVKHVQSEADHELRSQCLDRHRLGMRALVDELLHADAAVIERVDEAAASLPPVAECADVEALAAPTRMPSNPAIRPVVRTLADELAEIQAVDAAGRSGLAIVRAAALLPLARGTRFTPLVAETLNRLGFALYRAEKLGSAEAVLEEAAFVAQRAGHDVATMEAAMKLVDTVSHGGRRMAEGRSWQRFAEATLPRLRGGPEAERLHAQLDLTGSQLEYVDAHYAAAETHARRALSTAMRVAPESRLASRSLSALYSALISLGHNAEAEAHIRQNIALGLRIGLGPGEQARMQIYLGIVLKNQGRLDDARAANLSAIGLAVEAYGPDSMVEASVHNNLAVIEARRERYAEAASGYLRAEAIYKQRMGPDYPKVAKMMANRATALDHLGRLDEAREILERAREIEVRARGADSTGLLPIETQLTTVLVKLGRASDGRAAADRVLPLIERYDAVVTEVALGLSAAALAYESQPQKAIPLYRRALEAFVQVYGPSSDYTGVIWERLGVALIAAGDRAAAREALDHAFELAHADMQADARLALGQLDIERGDLLRGRALLAEALEAFGKQNNPRGQKEAERALARVNARR